MSNLAGKYGFPWLFGRGYLEGRSIKLHEQERQQLLDAETEHDFSGAVEFVKSMESQLASVLKDILKLEATPEPTRSLFFITSGGKKLTGG